MTYYLLLVINYGNYTLYIDNCQEICYTYGYNIITKISQRVIMTFIEFKKLLLDAEISLPKFSKLIKVSDKNLQSYKQKGEVPNTIAVIVTCFASMHKEGMDFREIVEALELMAKVKKGAGFAKKEKTVKKDKEPLETNKSSE